MRQFFTTQRTYLAVIAWATAMLLFLVSTGATLTHHNDHPDRPAVAADAPPATTADHPQSN